MQSPQNKNSSFYANSSFPSPFREGIFLSPHLRFFVVLPHGHGYTLPLHQYPPGLCYPPGYPDAWGKMGSPPARRKASGPSLYYRSFFDDATTAEIYTLSLRHALPI